MTTSVTIQSGETGATAPETPAVTPPAAATTETTPAKVERPAWLPEKFKDPEQMATAYAELEKRMGQPPEEKPAAKTEETPKAPTQEETQQALADKGLKVDEFNAEWVKEGKLSDASYEKLAAAGFSKDVVDGYIAGQQALADATAAELKGHAGGPEAYDEMVAWAKDALTDDQKAAFNSAVASGNKASASLAIAGLKAQFEADRGRDPTLLGGRGANSSDIFRSRQEQVAAIKDPRYGKDPAYTKDVQDKALRSFN